MMGNINSNLCHLFSFSSPVTKIKDIHKYSGGQNKPPGCVAQSKIYVATLLSLGTIRIIISGIIQLIYASDNESNSLCNNCRFFCCLILQTKNATIMIIEIENIQIAKSDITTILLC